MHFLQDLDDLIVMKLVVQRNSGVFTWRAEGLCGGEVGTPPVHHPQGYPEGVAHLLRTVVVHYSEHCSAAYRSAVVVLLVPQLVANTWHFRDPPRAISIQVDVMCSV
jgi:hypothetical protein